MTRARSAVIGVVVLALVVLAVTRLLSENGLSNPTQPPGLEGLIVPSAGVVRWSPDGTKIAVLAGGDLVLVAVADGEELARVGGTVVDTAWMPDATRVLVVEGPIPTGQIGAIRTDGRGAGTTPLRPSIAFGNGLGFAVDSRGTRAVAIAATRESVGGATRHDLAIVELQTGLTRVLATPDREEANPVFVDDTTVAYASTRPGGESRLHLLDLSTEQRRSFGVIHDGPFGVLASGEVVVGHRAAQGRYRLDAVDDAGDSRVLGVLAERQRPVGIDRFGTRALVRIPTEAGEAGLRIRVLRK